MSARPSLSVGIPTHFRSTDVARLVAGLAGADPDLAVTVIDDGPDPATARALAGAGPSLRLIRHAQNRGYAESVAELVEGCDTEYLLLSADDDLCDAAGLARARDLLAETRPDFAATQFTGPGGALRRGRRATGPVSLADLRDACGHAPGLIYRAAAARDALPFLRARLAAGCYAARVYPQVLMVAHIALAGGRCLWLPAAPITEGAAHPPALGGPAGQSYDSPAARLVEQEAFDAAFDALGRALPDAAQPRLAALRLVHRQDTYRRFMRALRRHHPDLVADWISGSLHYARASLPRHLLQLWRARRARRRALGLLRKDAP